MKKASELIKILTKNYTIPISEKHANTVLKIATLEERISTFALVGMDDKVKELNKNLFLILEKIREEFKGDNDV